MSEGLKLFGERHMHLVERVGAKTPKAEVLAPWKQRSADPAALLDRWLEGVSIPADTAIALSGVGDGSHIERLLQAMPESGLVFCAEPSPERFKGFLETERAKVLLRDERVLFGVGPLDDLFFRSLASFTVLGYTNAEPLIFAPCFQEAEEFYAAFFLEFARQLDMWRKLYGTNVTKSGLWQRNTFQNLRPLITAPDPIEFQSMFEGVPLIMAGAGPSLDESLEFVRSAQDKAVIVAGNSSIRALRRVGIDPHFVLAADPNPTTDRGFDGVELGRSVLVCPFLVYPKVVQRFGERVAAWSFGNEAATYFRKTSGRDRQAFVTEQGTVSACAFDLAVILGCPAIFFVGQDLAVGVDGRKHATDSFYADNGSDQASLEKCRWVPGNTLDKVPVEEKLFVYLRTFEELARVYSKELKLKNGKGLKLYNLSRQGARVEGMPYVPVEEALPVLEGCLRGDAVKGWKRVMAARRSYSVGWGRVGNALGALRSYVESVCSLALEEALALETRKSDLPQARRKREELAALIESRESFARILNDGQLKMELHLHRRAKALAARSSSGAERELEELKSYFWAVAEGAYHLIVSLELTADTSRERV